MHSTDCKIYGRTSRIYHCPNILSNSIFVIIKSVSGFIQAFNLSETILHNHSTNRQNTGELQESINTPLTLIILLQFLK